MLNIKIQNRWTKKLTFSLNPKKPRGFFPHTEPFPIEKPGAGVDLTFITRFILIPGAVRCREPLANLIRCVNWTNYYQVIEESNSKAPSLSYFIAFSARSTPTTNKSEKRHQQTSKRLPFCCSPTFTCTFVSRWILLKNLSFREPQSFWHVSMRDFKSPNWILTVRPLKKKSC